MPDQENEYLLMRMASETDALGIALNLLGLLVGLAIGVLLLAIAIRLAMSVLRHEVPGFQQTLFAAGVSAAAQFGIGISFGMSLSISAGMTSPHPEHQAYLMQNAFNSPMLIGLFTVGGLLLSGLVYGHYLRVDRGQSRLMFRDTLLIAIIANAMLGIFAWLLLTLFLMLASLLL